VTLSAFAPQSRRFGAIFAFDFEIQVDDRAIARSATADLVPTTIIFFATFSPNGRYQSQHVCLHPQKHDPRE
jgi:hypothetical protein